MTRQRWTQRLILGLLPALAYGTPGSSQDTPVSGVQVNGAQVDPNLDRVPQRLPGQASATIRGTVVDSVTGEPIYRALIQFGGQYATLTDHDGRFEFEGVVAPGVPPFAMKPGYFSDPQGVRLSSSVPTSGLPGEQEAPLNVVKLVPEAVLTGTVTGPDGVPVEGIPVQLHALTASEGLRRWRQRFATRTNSQGQYRFAELEAGSYAVTSGFHLDGLPGSQSASAYLPIRNPPAATSGTSEPTTGSEQAIVLAAGEHRQADLTPRLEKLYPVSGIFSGTGENRGVSFRVETANGEEITPLSTSNMEQGLFRLMLPGGTYQVTATGYLPQGGFEGSQSITVPEAPVNGLSFPMEAFAKIPVEVAREFAAPARESAGVLSSLSPVISPNISLLSVTGAGSTPTIYAQPPHARGEVGADTSGRLLLDNVAPGRYLLQAQTESPWYLASAQCGNVDLVREELVVGAGSAGCSLRVILRNDAGMAHVVVRGAPAPGSPTAGGPGDEGAVVYLLAIGDLTRPPVVVPASSLPTEGYPLPPGRYLVLALDHREELAYRDPEAMRRYAASGQEIVVAANGKADAEVNLIHGAP